MKILPNGIAVIENDAWISKWIEETGRLDHDQNLLPVLLPYIKPGDWVVDAGAFIGDHTIAYLNAVGPTGIVMAFEPNAKSFECLAHNCPSAICFNFGLSNECTWHPIQESENAGASWLGGLDKWDVSLHCKVMELDRMRLPRLDFLKIDVEGFELRVVNGASETLKRLSPVVCIEMNRFTLTRTFQQTTPGEIISLMESLGYSWKHVYPGDTIEAEMFDLLFFKG